MTRRSPTLASVVVASALTLGGVAGAIAPAAGTAPVPGRAAGRLTIQGGMVTDAAVAAATLHCAAGGAAVVVLSYHVKPSQRATYVTLVNGVRTHAGALRANTHGLLSTSTAVANHAHSRVILRLNGRNVVNAVVSPSCRRSVSVAAVPAATAGSPIRGSRLSYSLNTSMNGSVARWNPCDGTIHVRINATQGGAGALADALTALAALSSGTGLNFVYDGPTTFVPNSANSASQPAAVVLAWASPGAGAGQSNAYQPGAIGEGGWRSTGTSVNGGATWTWKITSGFVVVDPGVRLQGGFGNGQTRGGLLLHELGHVVGLGHTGDPSQVMFPVLRPESYGSYGAGDLAGLNAVGARGGCTTAS